MPADLGTQTITVTSPHQQFRNPSIFRGDLGQNPSKWLKEFDRVAKFNNWDNTVCLANVYFFLDGTAKQWFENNEDNLNSWDKFKTEIKKTFGDTLHYLKKAEEELKCRAQKPGESTQSYTQSVLGLCHQVNSNMPEDEKVSHLMKGVAEDVYQALLTKEIGTTEDFIKWCRYIEDMQQKRIRRQKFDRLPNVVPMAAMEEQQDLVSIIRQIVREEVQRLVSPIEDPEPTEQSLESVVREEVENALAPISRGSSDWTTVKKRRQPTYAAVTKRFRPLTEPQKKKTDIWRTTDNRPVCFHCGRPGHVVRYCRERKAIFDAYRANRRNISQPQSTQPAYDEEYEYTAARRTSPSPSRGRSPSRRYRSPSPYRRPSRSPSRRNEEN